MRGGGPGRRGRRLVAAGEAVYRALLRAYPRDFRSRFADEMALAFRDASRAALEAGRRRLAAAWLRFLLDLAATAVRERVAARRAGALHPPLHPTTRRGDPMGVLIQDVRHGLRALVRRPGFAAAAALTLGLGIGGTVAIFAVVNAVLIRPLPYPDPEQLVVLEHHAPGLNLPDLENSAGTIRLYRTHARSFSSIAVVNAQERNLTGGDRPVRVSVAEVSPELFDVLRVQPALGRRLLPDDAQPGGPRVAVLTHAGWSARFGRAPDIIGRVVEFDGVPTEIVGVMPEGFAYPSDETVALLPLWVDPNGPFGTFGLTGLARLAPGVTLESAAREVEQLQARIPEIAGDGGINAGFLERAGWSASVTRLKEEIIGDDVATALWVVLATVGFLLLVACASVANLFLVRAEARRKELAVRSALGATRTRLAAGFLSESVILGLAGGALGVLLAAVGVRALVAAGPAQLPRLHEVSVDATVLLFALALSVLAGLAFGGLPLPRYLRGPLVEGLREGRGDTGSRERQVMRKGLIAAQIALSLMLLAGSGLLLRSFQRLRAVDPGFRPEGVLTLGISRGERDGRNDPTGFYRRVMDEVRGLPGVQTVGVTNALPVLPRGINGSSFDIESRPRAEDALPPVAMFAVVGPGYFETMGIRLLEGRPMEPRDHEGEIPRYVWVSRSFARDFMEGRALGERVRFGTDPDWLEIAGVVEDVRMFGLDQDIRPMAYLTLNTRTVNVNLSVGQLVVRTAGDPMVLAPSVAAAVRRVAPDVPLTAARTMKQVVAESMAQTSFTMIVLIVAGTVSLLLGLIGLYGVIGYVVTQRTREIGLRIALGAAPGEVRGMVLRQGMALSLVGVAIGLAGALALSRLLESLLFGISSRDPLTLAAVTLLLVAASALAVYLPARRASAVSPMDALRTE
ncbi:MAG TPA: ABC transporter permease [Longimicrobiales bacterium]